MWKTLSKLVPALCLALVLAVPVSAQDSPFDGQWSADVPLPGGGAPVRFTLLLMADGDELRGTLQIGDARPVPIEEGRIRAGIVSFQRSLGDDGGVVRFLGRVMDDGLHVGFMQRPPDGSPAPPSGSSRVINFVAKRVSPKVHP